MKPPQWRHTYWLACSFINVHWLQTDPGQENAQFNLWQILEKLWVKHTAPRHSLLRLQCFFWKEETGKSYFLPPKWPSHSIGCWRKVTGYKLSPSNYVLYQKFTKSKVSNRKTIHSSWLKGTWRRVNDDCGSLWPKVISPDLAEWEPLSCKFPKAVCLKTD